MTRETPAGYEVKAVADAVQFRLDGPDGETTVMLAPETAVALANLFLRAAAAVVV